VNEPKQQDKPFDISKWVVWEAYQRVTANKGAAGVDGMSIAEFEQDRDKHLFWIWNRMSSGSYFPPPVTAVEIPKPGKKNAVRVLGVPTVADRVAQTVAKMYLEPRVEPVFHPDSYGYRPKKSALDAVGVCRRRCWKADWGGLSSGHQCTTRLDLGRGLVRSPANRAGGYLPLIRPDVSPREGPRSSRVVHWCTHRWRPRSAGFRVQPFPQCFSGYEVHENPAFGTGPDLDQVL